MSLTVTSLPDGSVRACLTEMHDGHEITACCYCTSHHLVPSHEQQLKKAIQNQLAVRAMRYEQPC